jgi:hopanoid biosynthesis associated protein HpnK
VGLHLALACGRAALDHREIPGLVDPSGCFSNAPAAAGFRYFFHRGLEDQLRREVTAQFERFRQTGLKLDHVNGHLHLHLHPVVFRLLMEIADARGLGPVRLTCEPFWLDVPLARGRRFYRAQHAALFQFLAWRARPHLRRRRLPHTEQVFGLLQNDHVDEAYLLKLLPVLPPGNSELYSHPSLDKFRHEFDALISPRVKARVEKSGIRLIRYQDL